MPNPEGPDPDWEPLRSLGFISWRCVSCYGTLPRGPSRYPEPSVGTVERKPEQPGICNYLRPTSAKPELDSERRNGYAAASRERERAGRFSGPGSFPGQTSEVGKGRKQQSGEIVRFNGNAAYPEKWEAAAGNTFLGQARALCL
uniref:Uncharacterized protein n=1 Tax=Sphaerodactylus townsendi TaxID=933632 RepID=A0ACB8E8A7_9SAUR